MSKQYNYQNHINNQPETDDFFLNSSDFSALINLSEDVFFIKDRFGNILDCNNNACKLFGYTHEEMRNLHSKDLLPDYLAANLPRIFTREMTNPNEFKNQRFIDSSGKQFEALVRTSISEIRGTNLWFESIKHDSESIALKQEVESLKEKIEHLSADHLKFISIISHELKSYLNTINGFSELMVNDRNSYSKSELLSYISLIKNAGNSGSKLLNNLLLWIRTQNGSLDSEPKMINLSDICNEMAQSLKVQVNEKELTIEKIYEPSVKCYCDNQMTSIAIHNIIHNAIKYSDHGSKIELNIERTSSEAVLSVKDFGTGMPISALHNVFKIIKTPHQISHGAINGISSGFGLPLCKELIEAQNGQIWMESIEGNGATVYFTLPLRPHA